MPINVRAISAFHLENDLPELIDVLCGTVNGGASLGFLSPLSREDARSYWLSLRPEMYGGSRVLLAAYADGHIVGAGQLSLPPWPNAHHRAEVQKLFVAAGLRGQGVGRLLMTALHDVARQRGRRLLLLNTRRGEIGERFYKRLGYREVGVVPGYSLGPKGERFDSVSLYQELTA
jgi:GNAT superfamily N-acetyltransferase